MKKSHCIWAVALLLLFVGIPCQAQSLKDLLNKGNIEKAVSALTGKKTFDMTGSWVYSGSAVEFESDNLLQQAGGALAATALEEKSISSVFAMKKSAMIRSIGVKRW